MIRTNQTFIAAIDFDFKNYNDNLSTQEKFMANDNHNHNQMIKDIAETYGVAYNIEYNTKFNAISVIFSTEKKYQVNDVHQAAKDFEAYLKSTGLFFI